MPPTPAEEICACDQPSEWLLRAAVSPIPWHVPNAMARSNLRRRGFLPNWPTISLLGRCFSTISTTSGSTLLNLKGGRVEPESPSSVVDRRGLAGRERLAAMQPTYYWWFQDAAVATSCRQMNPAVQPGMDA